MIAARFCGSYKRQTPDFPESGKSGESGSPRFALQRNAWCTDEWRARLAEPKEAYVLHSNPFLERFHD
jgi:hypothetical protein